MDFAPHLRRPRPLPLVLLTLAAVLGGAVRAPAQDDRAALLERVRAAARSLDAVRAEETRAREEQQDTLDGLRDARDRRITERVQLDSTVKALEAEAERAEARLIAASRPREGGSLLAWISAARGALAGLATSGRIPTSGGPTFATLRQQLNADDPADALLGISSLLTTLEEDGRRFRRPHLSNGPLAVNGREVHAYVLELGLVTRVFVTEDGKIAGLLDPKTLEPMAGHSKEGAEAARTAIAIQRKKLPPKLVILPHRGPSR